jgi:hypothetical protein
MSGVLEPRRRPHRAVSAATSLLDLSLSAREWAMRLNEHTAESGR